jgi:hypothetical protein
VAQKPIELEENIQVGSKQKKSSQHEESVGYYNTSKLVLEKSQIRSQKLYE